MFKTINNRIYLTRGDSAILNLSITDKDGNAYILSSGDTVVLTVKTDTVTTAYVIQKTLINGQFSILPSDTEALSYGDYIYDVQLVMNDGTTDTIIPPSLFHLDPEVTF
jgi:hypothetical protein